MGMDWKEARGNFRERVTDLYFPWGGGDVGDFVRFHQTAHLRPVHVCECKFYLNEKLEM